MSSTNLFITILAANGVVIFFVFINHIISGFKFVFKHNKYSSLGSSSQVRLIHQLDDAVKELAENKTGAIITIQNKVSMDSLRTDGVIIDANISAFLIISIFNKKSPLHDGAIVIVGSKIVYAGTYYKITESSVANKYGARHRAALGISEHSDSTTIVVSEETGNISLVKRGIIKVVKKDDFQTGLAEYLRQG